MDRLEKLRHLFVTSKLSSLFQVKREDDDSNKGMSAIKLMKNVYNIRAFELWEKKTEPVVRVYHGNIHEAIKLELDSHPDMTNTKNSWSDFQGEHEAIFSFFEGLLSSDSSKLIASKKNVHQKQRIRRTGVTRC